MSVDGQKRPYFIQVSDQDVFGFAGLWDRSHTADGTAIESCVPITMAANPMMQDVHNTGKNPHRMPAILRREDHEAWLGGSLNEARAALEQYAADAMCVFAASSKVNSPKNNSPDLLEPMKGSQTAMQ